MNRDSLNRGRRIAFGFTVIAILAMTTYIHYFLTLSGGYNKLHDNHPWYIVECIDKILVAAVIFLALYAFRQRNMFTALRLNSSLPVAFFFSLTASLPMLAGFMLTRKMETHIDVPVLLFTCLFSPFIEELQFRSFGFFQSRSRCAWPFIIAALPQALLFGLGHIEKGGDPVEMTSIFLILFAGAMVFAWLLDQWQNSWVPVFMHVLMNLWWTIFSISDTTLGGWFPLVLQLSSMLFAIVLTQLLKRRGKLQAYLGRNRI